MGVNGKLDDQAPIADVYLLMEHGNPKSARVYPEGHHMGRTPGQHPDEIANTIVGWLKEQLARVARYDLLPLRTGLLPARLSALGGAGSG